MPKGQRKLTSSSSHSKKSLGSFSPQTPRCILSFDAARMCMRPATYFDCPLARDKNAQPGRSTETLLASRQDDIKTPRVEAYFFAGDRANCVCDNLYKRQHRPEYCVILSITKVSGDALRTVAAMPLASDSTPMRLQHYHVMFRPCAGFTNQSKCQRA